jgi:DNA-binding XRE family transcriptional regulator
MAKKQMYSETALAALAKAFRLKSGKTKAEAARELQVTRPTMQLAEENPEQSLTKLRIRIIETYSPYRVAGPAYWLERK